MKDRIGYASTMTLTEELNALFSQPYMTLGSTTFTLGQVVLFALAVLCLIIFYMMYSSFQNGKRRAANEAAALERARQAEMKMAQLVESQNELTGRMQELGSSLVNRQTELGTAVNQRLDAMGGRIGQSITDTTKNTQETSGGTAKHTV